MLAWDFPIRVQFLLLDKESCAFSGRNLFGQNFYKFFYSQKTKESIITVYMAFHRCSVFFYRHQGVYQIVWSVLFTSLTTLIVYSEKRVQETYWCSIRIPCQEKIRDWILTIFTFNDKDPLNLCVILTLQFFEGQSEQGVTRLVLKPFGISQISRIVSLI